MKTMQTITNPGQHEMKIPATCAMISRKPADKNAEFKTAVIRVYDMNNPHKTAGFPRLVYEYSNIEKIRIKGLDVSYYLEGNDIIINDLEEIFIIKEDTVLVVKGYQFEVEKRR